MDWPFGALDWKWALGLVAASFLIFRLGYAMGRLVRDSDDIVPVAPTLISPATRAMIEDALRRGNKIEAIKILRQDTGCGLAEAKKTVEELPRPMEPR
jgi:hypothetical protein